MWDASRWGVRVCVCFSLLFHCGESVFAECERKIYHLAVQVELALLSWGKKKAKKHLQKNCDQLPAAGFTLPGRCLVTG